MTVELFIRLSSREAGWDWPRLGGALVAGLAVGLVAGLDPTVKVGGLVYSLKVYGLALMLLFGLIVGLVPALVHERSTPNEGITGQHVTLLPSGWPQG